MKWKAEFVGCKIGGLTHYQMTHEFESTDDPDQANLDLYKTHDHIGWLRLTNEHGDQFVRNYDTDRSADWTIRRPPCESSP